jgi:purine-binding chemotaxis protein CheW
MKKEQGYDIRQVLTDMRKEYWRGIEDGGEGASVVTREYLVVEFDGERYGFPAPVAREVLRVPHLVPVPRAEEHIRGIINLRGAIVAVTDLRPILGLSGREIPARGRLVVVEAAGLLTALLVARVEGIYSVAVDAIEGLTEGLEGLPREVVEGQVATEEGLLVLLDMEGLLGRPEFATEQMES